MDFRRHGFSNRTYQALSETIERDVEVRRAWKSKYDRMKVRFPDQNNYASLFDKLSTEDAIANTKFVAPRMNFPPAKKQRRASNEYLVKLGMQVFFKLLWPKFNSLNEIN